MQTVFYVNVLFIWICFVNWKAFFFIWRRVCFVHLKAYVHLKAFFFNLKVCLFISTYFFIWRCFAYLKACLFRSFEAVCSFEGVSFFWECFHLMVFIWVFSFCHLKVFLFIWRYFVNLKAFCLFEDVFVLFILNVFSFEVFFIWRRFCSIYEVLIIWMRFVHLKAFYLFEGIFVLFISKAFVHLKVCLFIWRRFVH